MGVNPIPEGYRTVTPYLIVDGAAELLDFAKQRVRRRGAAFACRRRTARSATPR